MLAEDRSFLADEIFRSVLWERLSNGKIYLDENALYDALNSVIKHYPDREELDTLSSNLGEFVGFYRSAGILNYTEIVPYTLKELGQPPKDPKIREITRIINAEMQKLEGD